MFIAWAYARATARGTVASGPRLSEPSSSRHLRPPISGAALPLLRLGPEVEPALIGVERRIHIEDRAVLPPRSERDRSPAPTRRRQCFISPPTRWACPRAS